MTDFFANIKTKKTIKISSVASTLIIILSVFLFTANNTSAVVEFTINPDYNKEISELNEEINQKRKAIDELNSQAEAYKKSISGKQREIASLSYQISTINQTITKVSLEKEALELGIEEINLQIENTLLKVQATEFEISNQKERMAILIRALYKADKESNLLSILASSDNVSDYFSQLQNLESLQDDLFSGLERLDNL